jgi:phage shock protein C
MSNNIKRLYRSKENRMIFGVCGGLGEYFEVDPLIIRILFILLSLTAGSGIILYLILAVIIPNEGVKEKTKGKKDLIEETQEKTQELAQEIKKHGAWISNARNIFGLVIILIGFNLLFEQIFKYSPFAWVNWGIFWSAIIIILGLRLIFNNKD